MAENNAVVRVYDPHAETEATIKELQRSGFDINKLSIVGKERTITRNGSVSSATPMPARATQVTAHRRWTLTSVQSV